jgi:hypothetical protein
MTLHAARQLPSWLIFDVRQKMRVCAASLILIAALLVAGCVDRKEEARLKAVVSPDVFAAIDEYRASDGRYPNSLRDISDARLTKLKSDARIGYLPEDNARAF